MGEEELDDYESTLELALVQEYKAVVGMFDYAVETDRRFYLANSVVVEVTLDRTPTLLEVTLHDAWVWDMYRSARFVPLGARADLSRRQHREAAQGRPAALSHGAASDSLAPLRRDSIDVEPRQRADHDVVVATAPTPTRSSPSRRCSDATARPLGVWLELSAGLPRPDRRARRRDAQLAHRARSRRRRARRSTRQAHAEVVRALLTDDEVNFTNDVATTRRRLQPPGATAALSRVELRR